MFWGFFWSFYLPFLFLLQQEYASSVFHYDKKITLQKFLVDLTPILSISSSS